MSMKRFIVFSRLFIKSLIVLSALVFNINLFTVGIILALFLVSEVYQYIIIRFTSGNKKIKNELGALVSVLDGGIYIFILYYLGILNSDYYLLIVLSIIYNAAEFGFLSGIVEGLVSGISLAVIYYIDFLPSMSTSQFFTNFFLRIVFITFVGWFVGLLFSQAETSKNNLKYAIENDIYEEKLNIVRHEFISVSKEKLINPISVIKGYCDLYFSKNAQEEDIPTFMKSISINIGRIETASNNLLNVLDMQGDNIRIEKANVLFSHFSDRLNVEIEGICKYYRLNYVYKVSTETLTLNIDQRLIEISLKNILFYILSFVYGEPSFNVSANSNILDININFESLKNDFQEIFGDDFSSENAKIIKVFTSRLIIESHGGSVSVEKLPAGKSMYQIKILIDVRLYD